MSLFLAFKLFRASKAETIEAREVNLEKEYKEFKQFASSQKYADYLNFDKEINSASFKKRKKAKDFKDSEDHKKVKSHIEFSKSKELKNHLSLVKKNDFPQLDKWELTFSEEFDSKSLDKDKWMTKYYWGEKLINDSYALEGEEHYFTDGKNVSINDSKARLTCRSENIKGKVWSTTTGLNLKDFKYTSALISTGKSFRQKYGKFQAKIKTDNIKEVENSFWMLSDNIRPHIDVLKTNKKSRVLPALFWNNSKDNNSGSASISKVRGVKLNDDFHIFTLEWTEKKMVWKVNDVIIKTQTKGIPQESMYMVFSLAVANAKTKLNANMEIDWVRCYKQK